MSLYLECRDQCLMSQADDSDCRRHGLIFRRVFRLAALELPAFEADLINDGMSVQDATERFKFRVETHYRRDFRVDESQPTEGGPYGFITIALVLITVVLAVISWLVKRLLDRLFPNRELQELATQADAWTEPEYAD